MIILDTHAWVWWVASPEKLSRAARRAIDEADDIGVCLISCWEIATLVRRKRLGLDRGTLEWVRQALALPRVELVPTTPEIAVSAGELPAAFRGDPADRLIVATTLALRGAVVSKDDWMRKSSLVQSVW